MSVTFSQTINADVWTLIVDGATATEFGIQLDTTAAAEAYLAIATATPAASSDDYIILRRNFDRSVSLTLSETDKVYVRPAGTARTKVRGYRVTR